MEITLSNASITASTTCNIAVQASMAASSNCWFADTSFNYNLSNVVIGDTTSAGNYMLNVSGNVNITGSIPIVSSIDDSGENNITGNASVHVLNKTFGAEWGVAHQSSNGGSWATGIANDSEGNVYFCGYSSNGTNIIFNSNMSSSNTTMLKNTDGAFLIKYNSNGIAQWAAKVDGPGVEKACGVCVDSLNNVYMMGRYTAASTIIYHANGTTAGTIASASGTDNGYVVKYNTNGIVEWYNYVTAARLSTIDINKATSTLYISGDYSANTTPTLFKLDRTTHSQLPTSTSAQAVVLMYAGSSGEYMSYTRIVGAEGKSIHVDTLGNFYITGNCGSMTIYNQDATIGASTTTGGWGGYIVKWNSNGKFVWYVRTNRGYPHDLTTDDSGNVFWACSLQWPFYIYSSNDFTSNNIINAGVSYRVDVIRFNSNGMFQWLNGISQMYGNSETGVRSLEIDVDKNGGVWLVYDYSNWGQVTFPSSPYVFLPHNNNASTLLLHMNGEDGAVLFAASVNTHTSEDYGTCLCVDKQRSCVYMGGVYGFPNSVMPANVYNPSYDSRPFTTSDVVFPVAPKGTSFVCKYNTRSPIYKLACPDRTSSLNNMTKTIVNAGRSAILLQVTDSNNAQLFSSTKIDAFGSASFVWHEDRWHPIA